MTTGTSVPAGCLVHGVPFGQRCYACYPWFPDFPQPATVSVWPSFAPSPSGWPCPRCGAVYAPWVHACQNCTGTPQSSPAGEAGPAGGTVPGFSPGDKVWPKAESPMILQKAPQTVIATWRDPVFGDWLWLDGGGGGNFSSWTAVHWTTEEPDAAELAECKQLARKRIEENKQRAATWPQWLDRPAATPAPCQPSREGGMCGCGEPDGAPVLALPKYMAEQGCMHIMRIGGEWTEVFPGLEGMLSAAPDGDGMLIARFRLTPRDGQENA